MDSEKIAWLANQIFTAFPQEVSGLKFYVLDCGCIYYQKISQDGSLDLQVGIYRDAENGSCEICILRDVNWKDRLLYEAAFCKDVLGIHSGHQ